MSSVNGVSGALSGAAIRRLVGGQPPLIEGAVDLDGQIQPNGIDLTLESVWVLRGPGAVGLGRERAIPVREQIHAHNGLFNLASGHYIACLAETIRLPRTIMALGEPRSTLLRCGVAIHNAVWDAGYEGRSELLLSVLNPAGFVAARGARIVQLIFLPLCEETVGYAGAYQRENLGRK